tara:strand:+ start:3494 stop:4942 length:1449 start_codon:yes stop_codon:yes gene_type:complete
MATSKTQVPSIPAPPKNEREATAFYSSVKEALEVRLGRRGDPKDRAVTLRELIDSGLAEELLDNPFDPNAGVGVTDFQAPPVFTDATIPPTPTGLSASAGTTKIIVNWNDPQISNLAHTEVWRSSDNSLGNAVRHDTTEAQVWVDSVDPADQFYYWIRHVTTSGIFSTFAGSVNATGALIVAGKIAANAITTTKIADDAITTPKIVTNAVTADSIAANTITTDNIASNTIQAGDIASNTLTSASGVFGEISAANITTGTLNGSNVTVTNLSAGNITSGNLSVDRIVAGSLNLAGKSVSGSVGTTASSNSILDSAIPDDTNVHNYLSTYWSSSPFHASGSTYVHIPTDSGGNKAQVAWTTPNWTAASSSSTTKPFIITASLNATGQLVGDGRAENLTAIAVRQTSSATGYQSSTASDFILSKSIVRAAGDHVLGTVIIAHKLNLLPNTTYYAWLFHGISDYGPSGSTNGGVSDAIITVQGLGV